MTLMILRACYETNARGGTIDYRGDCSTLMALVASWTLAPAFPMKTAQTDDIGLNKDTVEAVIRIPFTAMARLDNVTFLLLFRLFGCCGLFQVQWLYR